MMPRSAQSSLSHCTTTRPGMVAGSSGTTESSCPWQITMPPECCPRCRGRSCTARHSSRNLRMRGCRRSKPASRNWRSSVSSGSWYSHVPTSPESRSSVSSIEAQHLADLARRRAPAIGDDVGGHRRAAVCRSAGRRTGWRARAGRRWADRDRCPATRRALRERKRSNSRSIPHRIDRRDAQRVADRAVGRRPAPLHQNVPARGRSARCPTRSGNSRRARASRSAPARARSAAARAAAGRAAARP